MDDLNEKISDSIANAISDDIPTYISYYVTVCGEGINEVYFDVGFSAISRIYKMAEENQLPPAEKTDLKDFCNCDIVFNGKNFLDFIELVYPEKYDELKSLLNPDAGYTVMCVDFS